MIKDSGDRREFESGAVRDMHEGKGRCDLMPLEAVATLLHDDILFRIARFMDTYKTEYLYEALQMFAGRAFEGKLTTMLLEVAIHYEEGCKKYGPNNWKKGIPVWCYVDSATRHYLKFFRADHDERHDRAFVWNVLCCIWEVDHHNLSEVSKND
jgi:hypothetical protein